MPITDNMLVRVLPAAGDTAIKNVVSNANFTGTGTPTLVDEGSEKAWSITSGTLLDFAAPTKTIDAATAGSGATIALRLKQTNNGSGADYLKLVGIRDGAQTVDFSMWLGRNGNSGFRGRMRGASGDAAPASFGAIFPNGTVHTIVFKIESGAGITTPKVWRNQSGRVGTAADVTGSVTNSGAVSFNSAFINCQNSVAFTLLDFVYWDRELTDAECAAVADDIRGALTVTPVPVTFNGTVGNQSATLGVSGSLNLSTFFTGNQTPFSYSLVAGSLAGTGLSLNSSTGVISGTPSASGTISGLQVRATDTASNTAQTNPFNIVVAAAPQVPQGAFTIGSITVGQTTASVPYTYSASDQTGIQYRLGSTGTPQTASASPQALSGLTAGTAYTIEFRAVNAAGNGNWSSPANFTTSAPATASITSEPLKNNLGVLLANKALNYVAVYNATTGALVVRKTGLSTGADGRFTVSDAALVPGTSYKIDWETTTGERRMPSKAAV